MHNGKEKMCKFFVAHSGNLPVLGMQDIDKLGLLSINHNSKNRHMVEEGDKDNCESSRQIECNNHEQFKGKKQEAATQNTQEAKYLNPMAMDKSSKDSIAETKDNNSIQSFSEVLINQNLIADAETKDDTATIGMQFNYDSIDCLAESLIHNCSFIIGEKEKDGDDMATIGMQFNSIDFLAESLIHCNSFIIEEKENDAAAKNNIINNNNNESLVVGINTNVGKQAQNDAKEEKKVK